MHPGRARKLKVQNDLHLGKMIAAAFSRTSVTGIDAYLSSGLSRSEYWTKLAQKQARGEISMSSLNSNGKRTINGLCSAVSWYGMIALTQGGTIQECFGNLAIYCVESTNPALCWKKVLADLYGCDWYSILKRIAELAYNIRFPSDEAQQARLDQRKSVYEQKLSLTRATLAKKEKTKKEKKRATLVVPFEVQPVPQEPNVSFSEHTILLSLLCPSLTWDLPLVQSL